MKVKAPWLGGKKNAWVAGAKARLRAVLAEEQENKCYYCGVTFDETNEKTSCTLDHVIPQSRGGDNFKQNCVAACFSCNQERGDSNAKAFRRFKQKQKEMKWES